ncbi:MAG: FtsX-like permease family protein [Acidimicrobiales bacterium]
MSQLLATLRRRPAPLIGTFVALTVAALLVTVTAMFLGTSLTLSVPAQRLAGTAVVVMGNPNVAVTSGAGTDNAETDVLPLPDYRRVPLGLATRLTAVPGVKSAVPDISFEVALELGGGRVATGSAANPIEAHGWESAPLTPFRLTEGHSPVAASEIVLGAGLSAATGLRVGSTVLLAGEELPPFQVVGLATTSGGNPADNWTVFLSNPEAASLYGHPGQADLIGIVARPGVSATALASRVRTALEGSDLTVLSGTKIGQAENLTVGLDKMGLSQLATTGGIYIIAIAFFILAGTVALSVAMRWRNLALLRAVGATPGQVRRMIMLELAVLGALAGLVAYLPALALTTWAFHGLAAHQLLPPSTRAWTSLWVLPISAATGVVVAELAGMVSARRVSRIRPAAALVETTVEPRLVHPVRLLLGLCALGGGGALCFLMIALNFSVQLVDTLAICTGLLFISAIALLGPLVVRVAELVMRLPLLLVSGVGGRLALADVRRRPRRLAAAVSAVALTVSFVGAEYLIDVTQTHGAVVQGRQRLVADLVVSAPGPGLAPQAVRAIADEPGVLAAVGLIPTTVFVPDPGTASALAEAVTPGRLGAVLNLPVISGSLYGFGPGDIALSRAITGALAVEAKVGDTITTYLADGTAYRARVTAIYSRSLGFADVVVPAGADGGGHLGSAMMAEVLVRSTPGASLGQLSDRLAALEGEFAGLTIASRSAVNAQAEQYLAQQSYGNNLFLVVVILLGTVALVNTLVMATIERRRALLLLRRVGATTRQLLSMTIWQTVILDLVGITIGAAAGAASVIVVSKALADTWMPYLTWPPMVIIGASAIGLTVLSIAVPTVWVLASPKSKR